MKYKKIEKRKAEEKEEKVSKKVKRNFAGDVTFQSTHNDFFILSSECTHQAMMFPEEIY